MHMLGMLTSFRSTLFAYGTLELRRQNFEKAENLFNVELMA